MRQRKLILLLVAVFIFLLQTPSFADYYSAYSPTYSNGEFTVESGDGMWVVLCEESVSLRYLPSTDSATIVQVPLCDSVTFLGNVGNGFLYVNYNGVNGYILASYLDYYEPQIYMADYGWITNVNESASLRSLPSTSSPAYAQIPLGAVVTDVCFINSKFYRVTYNGVRGYVLKDLVQTSMY